MNTENLLADRKKRLKISAIISLVFIVVSLL